MKYRSLGGVVVAGCVAGVVAACAEPAMQGIGHAMAGAGGALAGMGAELAGTGGSGSGLGAGLAGAGAALATAGRALAGTGGAISAAGAQAGGSGGTLADEPTDDGLPNPRWILRDKDGAPVKGVVSPGYPTTTSRFASTPDCVLVSHYGQRPIGLHYALATGAMGTRTTDTCASYIIAEAAEWHVASAYWRYSDAECTKPISTTPAHLFSVGGKLYHSGTAAPTMPTTVYYWASYGKCESIANTDHQWAVEPVPADVVTLLPNPPYSLELVY